MSGTKTRRSSQKRGAAKVKAVLHYSDASRIELSPGIEASLFALPKPEWSSQSGSIEFDANPYINKQRVACTVSPPQDRHHHAPPLALPNDRLLSEVYHFTLSAASAASPIRVRLTFPIFAPVGTILSELTLKLVTRFRRDEPWTPIVDANFDTAERIVKCNVTPVGYYAVLGSVKAESFDVNPNGCLYCSRLNHEVSLRVPKGSVSQAGTCTLRIIPVNLAKMRQLRLDFSREVADVVQVSDIYDFSSTLPTTAATSLGGRSDPTSPSISGNITPEVQVFDMQSIPFQSAQFRRPATLKLPIPSWFNERTHSTDLIALYYKTAESGKWNYFTSSLRVQGPGLVTMVPLLARFMLVQVRDVSRFPLILNPVQRVEDYLFSFRGDVSAFMRYNREQKIWEVSAMWLTARDGEDRRNDSRLRELIERLEANGWTSMKRSDLNGGEEVPLKRIARAGDGSVDAENAPTGANANNNANATESNATEGWAANRRGRQRKSAVAASTQKLPSVHNQSMIHVTVGNAFLNATGGNNVSFAVYEDLPDFAAVGRLRCRASKDVETSLKAYITSIYQFQYGQLKEPPKEPDVIAEVKCGVRHTETLAYVLGTFQSRLDVNDLLDFFSLKLPVAGEGSPLESSRFGNPSPSGSHLTPVLEVTSTAATDKTAARAELARPRIPPKTIIPVKKELKVLNGRSLQTLARNINHGVALGMQLNMRESLVSGIAIDSMSGMKSAYDIAYRVLITWKRSATKDRRKVDDSDLVEQLSSALEQLGREDLSEAVRQAHTQNAEIRIPTTGTA